MATLKFNGNSYTVDHAVKGSDLIHGYDESGNIVISIDGIRDFSAVEYDGEFLTPEACLSEACNNVMHVKGTLVRRDGTALTPDSISAASASDVGNKEEVYATGTEAVLEEGCYLASSGEYIERSDCSTYLAIGVTDDGDPWRDKTIRIKTYMYGDMSIEIATDESTQHITNARADIERDPRSGIFEYDIRIPQSGYIDVTFTFCKNPYLDKPLVFEPRGNVWQEIKLLENSSGGGGGTGGADNRELYLHTNNKNNPHGVTAAQIGAVTQAELDKLVGDIESALDELHNYAQVLINGGGA